LNYVHFTDKSEFDSSLIIFMKGSDLFVMTCHNRGKTMPIISFLPKEKMTGKILESDISCKYLNVSDKAYIGAKVLFFLAVKMILYITSNKPDLKIGERNVSSEELGEFLAKERKNKSTKNKGVSVGSYIVIDKNISSISKLTLSGSEEDRKLTHRFMVRGHFRMQRYGPGNERVKRIWISPFWKGPDMAEVIQKDYAVKG